MEKEQISAGSRLTRKLLLADNNGIFRQGLMCLTAASPDYAVVDETSNSTEMLDLVWNNDYDAVLLDVLIPPARDLDILKQLKHAKSNLHILAYSRYPEKWYGIRALKMGAAGYISMDATEQEFLQAIEKVSNGKKYISPDLAERIAEELQSNMSKRPHERLSNREYQVMILIGKGKLVTEIADELGLSVSTIGTNRARILNKMNMKNNAQLTYYAVKEGLID